MQPEKLSVDPGHRAQGRFKTQPEKPSIGPGHEATEQGLRKFSLSLRSEQQRYLSRLRGQHRVYIL